MRRCDRAAQERLMAWAKGDHAAGLTADIVLLLDDLPPELRRAWIALAELIHRAGDEMLPAGAFADWERRQATTNTGGSR